MRKSWVPALVMEINDEVFEWKNPLAVEVEHIGELVKDKTLDLSDVVFRTAAGQPIYLRAVYAVLLKRVGRQMPFEQVDVPINSTEVYLVDEAGREVGFEVVRRECGYHREIRAGVVEDCERCTSAGVGPELDSSGEILWRYDDGGEPVPTRRSGRLSPTTTSPRSQMTGGYDPSPNVSSTLPSSSSSSTTSDSGIPTT